MECSHCQFHVTCIENKLDRAQSQSTIFKNTKETKLETGIETNGSNILSSLELQTKQQAFSSPTPCTPFRSWSFPTKREIAIKCFLFNPRPASIYGSIQWFLHTMTLLCFKRKKQFELPITFRTIKRSIKLPCIAVSCRNYDSGTTSKFTYNSQIIRKLNTRHLKLTLVLSLRFYHKLSPKKESITISCYTSIHMAFGI